MLPKGTKFQAKEGYIKVFIERSYDDNEKVEYIDLTIPLMMQDRIF